MVALLTRHTLRTRRGGCGTEDEVAEPVPVLDLEPELEGPSSTYTRRRSTVSVVVIGAPPLPPLTRGFHSFTLHLNLSTFRHIHGFSCHGTA
jgi:hypothetical protein